jgi:gluconate:H+ symporter, GntP family
MEVWILVVVAILTVLLGILWLRLHPFLVLMTAGLLVALGTTEQNLRQYAQSRVASGSLRADEVDGFVATAAPKRLVTAFGNTTGNVGVLIALAGVIGACLMSSGAAMVIVDSALKLVGVKRAPVAMAASSFVLGIPVFFDTVFYLMVPLARSLRRRTGKQYVFYILAIMSGGSIAHSLVPPTPGPLQVAEIIGVDLLTLMIAGLVIGALSSTFSLLAAWWLGEQTDVPLRPLEGSGLKEQEMSSVGLDIDGAGCQGPPVWMALLPIVLPIVLIAGLTAFSMLQEAWPDWAAANAELVQRIDAILQVIGDRNVALGIGAAISMGLLRWAPQGLQPTQLIADAIVASAGIILITGAGGAFGAMLGQSGVASMVAGMGQQVPGYLLLPMAFGVTAAIRTMQGSATVAMITAAGILQGFASSDVLPYHPVYLALAIGGGSKPISWMTDSGFWIMCKMSGMTEAEGLRTVSPLTVAMGLSTLFWTMLAAALFPMR